jgi:hypothetical protein
VRDARIDWGGVPQRTAWDADRPAACGAASIPQDQGDDLPLGSRTDRVVIVELDGDRPLLVTPEDPEGFVARLRA